MTVDTDGRTILTNAAKELNIGVLIASEFLQRRGHEIENKPSAKLSPEMFAALNNAFKFRVMLLNKSKI